MLYAQGVDVRRFLDEPSDTRFRARARTLTLQGRDDLAQHFLISAGIAAAGGSRLADAVGLFKELDDSRSGSGFSFTDLAADRAGVRFAESATGPNAARLQGLLADKAEESLFMPRVRDLPEFMPEDELVRRFGGVDSRSSCPKTSSCGDSAGSIPRATGRSLTTSSSGSRHSRSTASAATPDAAAATSRPPRRAL